MRKVLLMSLGVVCAAASARADIPPRAPPGRRLVTAVVRFEGLSDPGWVLAAFHAGRGKIGEHVRFTASSPDATFRADGSLDGAGLRLFPKDAWDAWSAETSERISAQREACFERNEGCAHPSRFSPTYPPPEGGVDCQLALQAPFDGPEDGPGEVMHRVKVLELGASICRLETVAAPGRNPSGGGGLPGCGAAAGAGLLAGIAGLMLARRRGATR